MTKEEKFIEEMAFYVLKYAKQYNILCHSAVLGQFCLESGFGTSELAIKANNYAGLKYRKNRCPTSNGTYVKIGSEQDATTGQYISSSMLWFSFRGKEDFVRGYFDFINIPNYASLKGIKDTQTFLETIKKCKYATSIDYVSKVMKIVKKYNLTRYDSPSINIPSPFNKKYYRVQIGAYSKVENAEVMLNKLKKDGFNAIIKEDNKYKRVQVGAFSNKANAENYADILNNKGYKTYIVYM